MNWGVDWAGARAVSGVGVGRRFEVVGCLVDRISSISRLSDSGIFCGGIGKGIGSAEARDALGGSFSERRFREQATRA